MKNHWLDKRWSKVTTWVALYMPKRWKKEGFPSERIAREFALSCTSLDPDAWFFVPTKVFVKCKTLRDLDVGAGYYPSDIYGNPDRGERWREYLEICERIGVEPYDDQEGSNADI